jgi:tetratricopeptide (TPR) repeat protein
LALTAVFNVGVVSGGCEHAGAVIHADLYIMPRCPYGLDALRQLLNLRREFGKTLELRVHFIGSRDPVTAAKPPVLADYHSLHGPEEVETTLASTLVSHLYPDRYFSFLEALAEDDENPWRGAAEKVSVDVELLENQIKSPDSVLWLDFAFSDAWSLGITQSPTIFIENNLYDRPAERDRLLQAVCAKTRELRISAEGCASAPECIADADCEAPPGMTAYCGEQRVCVDELEPPVRMRILVSSKLDVAHVRPSIDLIRKSLPSLHEEFVFLETPEGATLAADTAAASLPVFVLDPGVIDCRHFSELAQYGIKEQSNNLRVISGCPVPAPFRVYGRLQREEGKIAHVYDDGLRAFALQAVGKVDEAEQLYLKYLEDHPGDTDALKNLGVIYLGRNQFVEAVHVLESAAAVKPEDVDVYDKLVDVCRKSGRTDYQPYMLVRKAFALQQQGQPEQACAALREALDMDSEYAPAQAALGSLLLHMDQPADAIPHFEKALKLTGEAPETLNCLAGAYWRTGRLQEALSQYARALALEPANSLVAMNLAKVHAAQGNLPKAIEVLTSCPGICEDSVDAAGLLIDLFRRSDQPAQGVALARRLGIRPSSGVPLIRFREAQCFAALGEMDNARNALEAGLTGEALPADLSLPYAEACVNLGMADEAVRTLSSRLRFAPSDTTAHALLCFLHTIQGRADREAAKRRAECAFQFGVTIDAWEAASRMVRNTFQLDPEVIVDMQSICRRYRR